MPPSLIMWIHLLAATGWIGGLIGLQWVLRPLERAFPQIQGAPLGAIESRFRTIRWASLLTLLGTGVFNLIHEGDSARLESEWGVILVIKLLFVAVAVGLTAVQDFLLSPAPDRGGWGQRSREWLSNAILMTALLILWLAVYLRQS